MTETAASSSGVPMSVTSSPAATGVSRPGQTSTCPAGGTTATGASAPYSSRSVAAAGAVVRAARNRIPDSVISCTPSPRQTSTTDGADRPATSRTPAPAPGGPADISVSSARAGPVTSGTLQAAIIRASAGAGSSSTTTAGTPD